MILSAPTDQLSKVFFSKTLTPFMIEFAKFSTLFATGAEMLFNFNNNIKMTCQCIQ